VTVDPTRTDASTTVAVTLPAPGRGLPPLPALTLLGHPDWRRIGERALLGELASGRETFLSRRQPRFSVPEAAEGGAVGCPLEDRFLSRKPLRLEALPDGGVRLCRDGSPMLAAVDGEPLETAATLTAERLEEGVVLELAQRVVLLLHRVAPPPEPRPPRFGLVGDSDGILRVRQAVARAAPLDLPVLLTGETGSGKELVARALHGASRCRGGPFVSVNLGALPPSLAAAELFGAKKGAFTGAVADQPGFFGRADGGTLFLDEVGEAPPEVQVMLLRTLETGEVLAVGSQKPRRVDVRIVSATDADLERRIAEGGFRAPLLHRLAGYPIPLPPLARRRDDIGRLLIHFLCRERERLGEPPPPGDPDAPQPWLPATLVARLARESWPGNVRQLENVARRLVIDNRGQPLLTAPPRLAAPLPAAAPPGEPPPAPGSGGAGEATPVPPSQQADETPPPIRRRRKPSQVSEEELLAALREHRWELKATARALGIARTSLYDLMKRSPRVRPAAEVPAEEIRRAFDRCGGDLSALVGELEVSERALRQRLKDLGLR
jgi:two-component system nitrogen regulation response regulator GlnG